MIIGVPVCRSSSGGGERQCLATHNSEDFAPNAGGVVRLFIFKSDVSPDLGACCGDLAGLQLPSQFKPLACDWCVASDKEPPYKLSREVIEASRNAAFSFSAEAKTIDNITADPNRSCLFRITRVNAVELSPGKQALQTSSLKVWIAHLVEMPTSPTSAAQRLPPPCMRPRSRSTYS